MDICFQISQGKHLEVELLGHMLSICLTLHVIVWLLHILAKHGIFSLLHFSLSSEPIVTLTVVLVYISRKINNVEHFFHVLLLAFCLSSFMKC